MNRKAFLNKTCQIGVCACSMVWLNHQNASAGSATSSNDSTDNWKIPFMQKRFAHLIRCMDTSMEKTQRNQWLEDMGKICATEYAEHTTQFKNKPGEYLNSLKGKWIEDASYEKSGEMETILIRGQKKDRCFCPFVDNKIMPSTFCSCSLGFQKQVFSTILERPVNVELINSILQGSERCSFKVTTV